VSDENYMDWKWLSDTQTQPAVPITTGTVTFSFNPQSSDSTLDKFLVRYFVYDPLQTWQWRRLQTLEVPIPSASPTPTPLPSTTPSPTGLIGDTNQDGVINRLDIEKIIETWLQNVSAPVDLNNDMKINGFDFGQELLYTWNIWQCSSQGSCVNGEICPAGTECSGLPAFGCYPPGCPTPICLPETAVIGTPDGNIRITELKAGHMVWSTNLLGEKIAVPVKKVSRTPVPKTHMMVEVTLYDGRVVTASAGHPTTSGKTFGQLRTAMLLDGSTIVDIKTIPYTAGYTYDLLPDSDTGFYWANGVLIASTLKRQ
jgi:hypothetical protein